MRFIPTLFIVIALVLTSCAAKKHKDISYISQPITTIEVGPKLNVFTPRKTSTEKLPILIFIHGGNWNSGRKDTYGFYGRNFAKKGVVTVIPNYTLSPQAIYDDMAQQTAQAMKWTKAHIEVYNGDPENIYLTGTLAGRHLAALAFMNPKYGIDPGSISGIILNDSGDLDMYSYLQKKPPTTENNYLTPWTEKPEIWKSASPIYFSDENTPTKMIYLGSKSYPFIKVSNFRFIDELKTFQPNLESIVLPKRHIAMIVQYFFPWDEGFDEIKNFMEVQTTN